MTDHDLPPDRRLPDEVRMRMKQELIEQTGAATGRRTPGWLAAGVAAAAVAAIALGGAWLMSGDDDPESSPGQVAGSGDPTPTQTTADAITPPPTPVTPPTEQQPPPQGVGDCRTEVAGFLPAAERRGVVQYAGGLMELWGTGQRWLVCDTWAATVDGGVPTLVGGGPGGPGAAYPTGATRELFRISMNFGPDGESQFFSGGAAIPGVTSIVYAFPGGDEVDATLTDEMWGMAFLPTDGPMAQDRLPEGETITVTVTSQGGATEEFTLEVGPLDLCAQVNHGC